MKGYDQTATVAENPCRLARDIRGIGFGSADQIAAKLGIERPDRHCHTNGVVPERLVG